MIRVESVNGRRGHRVFYRVRQQICRRYPQSALPLRFMEWSLLDTDKHPFYQHARREMFVAFDGANRPVGRIAAMIDDMHQSHYGDRLGTFGFFECDDDVQIAKALMDTAARWLRAQGCDRIRGPLNPSMKGEFGVLVEGNDYPPFFMIAWTPAYYDRLLQECGFEVCKRFFAFLLDTEEEHESTVQGNDELKRVNSRILARFPEIKVERANRKNVGERIREINRIGNTVRSEGFGFVPNTDQELDYMVRQIGRIIDPRLVITATVHEQLAAYNVSIPNLNWALRKSTARWQWVRTLQFLYWMRRIPEVRLIALGVDPKIRAKGLSALVTQPMVAMHSVYKWWEFSWIAEDNVASMAALFRAVRARQYKTLQLYERAL